MGYQLADLLDIPALQQLMEDFYALTGMVWAILDQDGTVLVKAGWRDICEKFHRCCPQTEFRCRVSDSFIKNHLRQGAYIAYQCLNGLMDYASPIIVDNEHLGTVFTGQVLNEPPNEEFFRQQAREYGFAQSAYLEALSRVPVIPGERMESIMSFLLKCTRLLTSMGVEKMRRLEAEKTIREREERLQLVLDGSNDGFWDWDIRKNEVYYSHRWAEMLGYSPGEVEPNFSTWARALHPDDRDAVMNELKRHLKGNTPYYAAEFRLLSKTGEWKWILARGKVVARDEQGYPLRMAGTHTDITCRKHTEEALRSSEELYRSLVETSPNAITVTDLEGGILLANQRTASMYGYSDVSEIIGEGLLGLITREDADRARLNLEKTLKEGVLRNLEYTCVRRDGSRFPVECNSAVVRGADDKPRLLINVMTDITSRKLMEQKIGEYHDYLEKLVEVRTNDLKATNERLQEENARRQHAEEALKVERNRLFSVLDGLPALVYLLKPDYSIPFANKFFWDRFGKPNGQPCYKLMYGRIEPCNVCHALQVHEKDSPLCWDGTFPDGHTYRWHGFPFYDVDGTKMVLKFGLDITNQKQAETALRLSEEKFSKAFRSSPDLITISTLEEGVYVDVNNSFLNTTGYLRHEVIGRSATDLEFWVNPEERDRVFRGVRESGTVRNREITFRTKSGEERTGLVSADAMDIGGKLHVLGVIRDITERKRMQKEMAQLERFNLVGQIAASIGHEIRNPMTTVRGFLQVLRGSEKNLEGQEYFDLMIEELDRANSIITEFLSLARDKIVELKARNLNTIIMAILPLIQANAMVKDQKVRVGLEQLPQLLLDEKEIRQLILNLARNGLEAMPPGGTLDIRTFREDDNIVLVVQDEGHGMNGEELEKLGTPFFTTKEQGTGLGLAVCYGIARRHNASIDVETSPAGTIFYVRFSLNSVVPS